MVFIRASLPLLSASASPNKYICSPLAWLLAQHENKIQHGSIGTMMIQLRKFCWTGGLATNLLTMYQAYPRDGGRAQSTLLHCYRWAVVESSFINFLSASASLNLPALPTMLNLTVNLLCSDQVMPPLLHCSTVIWVQKAWNGFFSLCCDMRFPLVCREYHWLIKKLYFCV